MILAAPSARKIDFRFHGRAAHSGMYPEEGRSAIAAAARAIADFRLGRLDDETTANVGMIEGGTARNIVPEWCTFEAEARSLDDRKLADVIEEMLEAATFAASLAECDVETEVGADYKAYRFARDDDVVRLAVAALERTGHEPRFETTGGGADANVFNERGPRVPEPRQRDDGHPHARRADRGRRPRRDGRGHARADRRRARWR